MIACTTVPVIVVGFKVIGGGVDNQQDTTPGAVRFHFSCFWPFKTISVKACLFSKHIPYKIILSVNGIIQLSRTSLNMFYLST